MSNSTVSSVETLWKLQLSTYIHISAVALFIYEYFITLEDEITYVWQRSMRLGRILFLLNRYSTIAGLVISLLSRLTAIESEKQCQLFVGITSGFFYFGFVVADLLMLLRVWALWGRTRFITIFLSTLSGLGLGTSVVVFATVRDPKDSQAPADHALITGCAFISSEKMALIQYAMVSGFETLILFLTLARCIHQARRTGSMLFVSFIRHGVLYFIGVLALSIFNVTIILTNFDDGMDMVTSLQRAFHSILAAHLFLQLRKACYKGRGVNVTRQQSQVITTRITTIRFVHSALSDQTHDGNNGIAEGTRLA